jgi:hypothetical protein
MLATARGTDTFYRPLTALPVALSSNPAVADRFSLKAERSIIVAVYSTTTTTSQRTAVSGNDFTM